MAPPLPIILLILPFWFLAAGKNLLFALQLWQIKEYRLDRFRSWLGTAAARRRLLAPLNVLKWLLIFFYISGVLLVPASLITPVALSNYLAGLIGLIFLAEGLWALRQIIGRRLVRPRPTGRILITLAAAAGGLLMIFFSGQLRSDLIFRLLLIDRASPLLVSCLVLAGNPLMWTRNRRQARLARRKREGLKKLPVIGITGSYGKSSVKEFLATLLADRFHLVKTQANVNTDIGIAQTILNDLSKRHNLLIVEMGAYRRGEIARAAQIARPTMGIVTGLTSQHLDLFGSSANIGRAKFELIASLPPGAAAIFNNDCALLRPWIEKARLRGLTVLTYGTSPAADLRASRIRSTDKLEFVMTWQNQRTPIKLNLLGAHQALNFLAASLAALRLGLRLPEIAARARLIKPRAKTLELRKTGDRLKVIDDSYNANPVGVRAALTALSAFPARRRICLLSPIIELGGAAASVHQVIAGQAVKTCDLVLITDRQYEKSFRAGAGRRRTKLRFLKNPTELKKWLSKPAAADVLLIAGRPPRVYQNVLDSLS